MAFPTISNSFATGANFFASHANANFEDMSNAVSDGLTDVEVNKVSLAGTATVSGTTVVMDATAPVMNFTNSSKLTVNTITHVDLGAAEKVNLGGSSITNSSAPATNAAYTNAFPKAYAYVDTDKFFPPPAPSNATGILPHGISHLGGAFNFDNETSWDDTAGSGSVGMIINLRTPMKDSEYTVICTARPESATGVPNNIEQANISVVDQTTTGFVVRGYTGDGSEIAFGPSPEGGFMFCVFGDQ